MDIEQIGLMLYKKGWIIRRLVNNFGLCQAGLSQTCLEVGAQRKNFHISIIAGASGNHSDPKAPSEVYNEVEVLVSKGEKERCMSYVDEDDFKKIINAPSKYV